MASQDIPIVEGHDENEHDDHDKTCMVHDNHWQDDYAYVSSERRTERLESGEDPPRTADMAQIIGTLEDVPIYRFAVVYVNAETGNIQVATNPGMSGAKSINLLTRAAAIMAFQEASEEDQAEAIILHGMKRGLATAIAGEGEMPDLSGILGGLPNMPQPVKEVDDKADMRDGYL